MQEKTVVHLQPHRAVVDASFGGKLLELINSPAIVHLPIRPPLTDTQGNPWSIDVKNLGPRAVTIVDNAQFKRQLMVGQTLHINSNGTSYSVRR
jgi:hypothetical protein